MQFVNCAGALYNSCDGDVSIAWVPQRLLQGRGAGWRLLFSVPKRKHIR